MKYLDTNIAVRVITGDDRALAQQAIHIIESGSQGEFSIIDAVLVELCFILEFHTYRMARKDIAAAIETLVGAPQIMISNTSAAALKLYKEHPKLDYTDCLLLVLGGKNGVVTFDKDSQQKLLR